MLNGQHTVVSCAEGALRVNQTSPPGAPIACAAVQILTLQGGPTDDWLDGSALRPEDFPALQRVIFQGGAGSDTLTASPFTDILNGGLGSDVFVGAAAEDQTDADSADFFMEALPLGNTPAMPASASGGLPAPASPATEANFGAINFDTDGANNGYYHIPPDPHGAAGPNHVVNVVNTSIEWYTKDGTQQHSGSLQSFFTSLSPVNNGFDPKVIYDQYEDRFLVVALERQDTANGDPVNSSRILLAVSATSDPNGTWYYTAINSMVTIGGTDTWADYPGFAVDDKAVYLTANMFGFGGGTYQDHYLWIVDKGTVGGFYAGGTAGVTAMSAGGAYGGTIQPAHTFGTPPAGMGTYLVLYSGLSGVGTEYIYVGQVTDPLGTPAVSWQPVSLGDIDDTATAMPEAPQLGSGHTIINTNDRRTLNAVWRNNALWVATTVLPGSGTDIGQATAHWIELNANGSAVSLADQGNIGGEDIAAGTYTFFPSVMVDSCGNMAVGFAASGSNIYPGAYYAARFASDTAGTVHAGVDYYYRVFGGTRNRWGDYTGISLDPANESTFWVFNQYAMARGSILPAYPTEDGRWATQWGSFDLGCADTNVVLSEVMFDASTAGETGYEWVELYNKGTVPMDVRNWQICDVAQCRTLTTTSTTIAPNAYWLIATSAANLTTEFTNEGNGDTPNPAQTIYLGANIGNGLSNTGDAVFLLNGGAYCGSSGTDACTVDCVSWDATNTCVSLIAAGTRSYLPGADGADDTALSSEQNGQSIVNIQGTWYQSGPLNNTTNQASPYQYNTAEGGTPTALTLKTFGARPAAAYSGALAALALGGAAFTLRRRTHRKTQP